MGYMSNVGSVCLLSYRHSSSSIVTTKDIINNTTWSDNRLSISVGTNNYFNYFKITNNDNMADRMTYIVGGYNILK